MRNLDLKGGKEIFINNLDNIDENKSIYEQHLSEDLMAIRYDNVIIDVGSYKDGAITIMVILVTTNQDWSDPYCVIRCFDYDDFYIQLQRAIDIYPNIVKELICQKII